MSLLDFALLCKFEGTESQKSIFKRFVGHDLKICKRIYMIATGCEFNEDSKPFSIKIQDKLYFYSRKMKYAVRISTITSTIRIPYYDNEESMRMILSNILFNETVYQDGNLWIRIDPGKKVKLRKIPSNLVQHVWSIKIEGTEEQKKLIYRILKSKDSLWKRFWDSGTCDNTLAEKLTIRISEQQMGIEHIAIDVRNHFIKLPYFNDIETLRMIILIFMNKV
jgi:hypothetical protein